LQPAGFDGEVDQASQGLGFVVGEFEVNGFSGG